MDRLAADLRAIRADTGKSLKQLQRVIHVSDSSLSRYLSGNTVPPWKVVEALCLDAGRPAAAVHALHALWEQASRERNGADGAPDADPRPRVSAASVDVGRPDLANAAVGDALVNPSLPAPASPPEACDTGGGVGAAWWRRHTAAGLAVVLVGTAAIFGSLGLWVGARLLHPAAIVVTKTAASQQDAVCASWPWPAGQSGQAVGPAAQVRGAQHTAVVELVTGTVNGRQMAWARIRAAVYGDRVWMDWSQNDGRTWVQCGPFLVTGADYATRAHEIDPTWKFRACGDTPIAAQGSPRNNCTGFW